MKRAAIARCRYLRSLADLKFGRSRFSVVIDTGSGESTSGAVLAPFAKAELLHAADADVEAYLA